MQVKGGGRTQYVPAFPVLSLKASTTHYLASFCPISSSKSHLATHAWVHALSTFSKNH